MARNTGLSNANKAKKDEFYTQLADIEVELKHYKKHFKGKVVLCNCDDPYESNFFKYFAKINAAQRDLCIVFGMGRVFALPRTFFSKILASSLAF